MERGDEVRVDAAANVTGGGSWDKDGGLSAEPNPELYVV